MVTITLELPASRSLTDRWTVALFTTVDGSITNMFVQALGRICLLMESLFTSHVLFLHLTRPVPDVLYPAVSQRKAP